MTELPEKLRKVHVVMTRQTLNIITGCLADLGLKPKEMLRIGCDSEKEKGLLVRSHEVSVPSKAQEPILTESKKSVNKEKVINTNIKNGCEKERTGFRFVRREDLEAEMNSPSQAPKEEKGREK